MLHQMKITKGTNRILILLSLVTFSFLVSTCTKEDSELLRKESLTNTMNGYISADSLESAVMWMQQMGTRFALSGNNRNVAVEIKKRFIRLGYSDTKIDSFTVVKLYRGTTYQGYKYNVIATLQGSTESDSVCIIGGHYDNILASGDPFTIVPGANDNASGVAVTLEIARVMKKNGFKPRNSIKFIAFGSEELGLYGSHAYAADSRQTLQKIMLMLNNDMVAYDPDISMSSWTVNIINYNNSLNLRKQAEQLCSKYTGIKYTNNNSSAAYSDSYPFFLNGFKTLFFISAKTDPNYHTLNDLASKCNFEFCREVAKLNCAIIVDRN
jgi:hypothetical protein